MSTGQRPQIDAGKVRAVERLGSHRPRFGFAVIARLQQPERVQANESAYEVDGRVSTISDNNEIALREVARG